MCVLLVMAANAPSLYRITYAFNSRNFITVVELKTLILQKTLIMYFNYENDYEGKTCLRKNNT